jgi:3-dehydroquinate dehydratase-1
MTPQYCLPILKSDKAEVLGLVQANLDNYGFFEVWLDYVEDIDDNFMAKLGDLGERLVVTFRRKDLETPKMDAGQRQKLLESLANTPVLVDLDITTQKAELDQAKGLNLVTSYHNYQKTPDTLQLEAIIDTMRTYQPAVFKLSTLCQTAEDALRLLQQLLKLKDSGLDAIVSGMGEHGAATRIFGPLWGSKMVFAPLDADEASAPGQLTRQQLETIFKELGNAR